MRAARVVSIGTLLVLLASACGGDDISPETVVVFLPSDNPGDIGLRRRQAEQFMEANPDIPVRVQVIPSEAYNERVYTSIAGGNPPDIFNSGDVLIPQIVDRGAARDLNDFVDEEGYDLGVFYPEIIDGLTFEGQLVGLTDNWDTQVMYYNRTLFDDAGLAHPTAEWNWDDLVEAARAIDTGEGIGTTWGFLFETWFAPMHDQMYSFGGQAFSDDGTQCLMDQPAAVEAVQSLVDAMEEGLAPTPQIFEQEGEDPFTTFAGGRAGMWLGSGRWAAFDLQGVEDLDWAIAPRPAGPGGIRSNFFHLAMYAITARSNSPDNAWEFLKFMVSEEGIRAAFESMQGIPSRPALAEDPEITNTEIVEEHDAFQPFVDSLPTVRPAEFLTNFPQVEDAMADGLDPVWGGEQPVESTLVQICDEIDALLAQE